ncbi:MAG: sigma-54-dependent Fis family transcriptional regulator [Muribaculaceae bacterium]|nr:sigma-54-dependent Fis family transcriptional regulator [Muribaculaceae bacterium]MBQ7205347.1 sigma-54-dependent Fis family transcriptional regulator [Muribaculaceae bacterium]
MTDSDIRAVKLRFGIVGESPALIAAIRRAMLVAPIDLSVLVIGESGSGKESFPKIIHESSPRKHKKYIAVNCGAIPEGTIDSELFGHVKGSFTGAIVDHKGYFEEADGGVIFLDEVAEMPMSTQARLLRVLENGEYLRVGDSTVRKTNIRIVAATNKDMLQAVKEGKFREDLYYRLSTVQINVPPLRDRGDDVLLLSRLFLRNFITTNRTAEVTLGDDAQRLLKDYHWPGNVRQLKSVIEQVALFEAGNVVDAATLSQYMPSRRENALTVQSQPSFDYNAEREQLFTLILSMRAEIDALKKRMDGVGATSHVSSNVHELKRETSPLLELGNNANDLSMVSPYRDLQRQSQDLGHVDEVAAMDVEGETVKTLDETERETIENALRRNNGRRKLTAQELNISERTLYRKIKQYNLERQ